MKNKFILRVPRFSFDYFNSIIEFKEDKLFSKLLKNDDFMHAIELASPSFYSYIKTNNIERNEKAKKTLIEYFSRSSVRCIPFGGFAGLGILEEGETIQRNNEIKIKDYNYSSYFNTEIISQIAESIMTDRKLHKFFHYSSNAGLFSVTNEKYRYIEHYLSDTNIFFEIAEFKKDEILNEIISYCTNKKHYCDIFMFLTNKGFPEKDSENFINLLIENKILISELELTTVGKTLEYQLLDILNLAINSNHNDTLNQHKELLEELITILQQDAGSSQFHNKINNKNIRDINTKDRPIVNKNLHFHFDGNLDEKQVKDIEESTHILNLFLTEKKENNRFQEFKQKFEEKYGNSSVNLCKALDSDIGINYDLSSNTLKNNTYSDLVKDFPQNEVSFNDKKLNVNYIDEFLMKKISISKENIINISEEEIHSLEKAQKMLFNHSNQSPLSIARFSLFKDRNTCNNIVHIKSISNTSPNKLIGRFTQKNKDFFELSKEIAKYEDNYQDNDNIIHAEVDYKSNLKSNNIINREEIRKNKITFFSYNGNSDIRIGELFLSLEDGEFVIRSNRTKKKVIPHFSSAYNEDFSYNLPIFKFFIDFENQYNKKEEIIDTRKYHNIFSHIPRIIYRNTILHPESWIISISYFKENERHKFNLNRNKEILSKLGVPRFFYIIEGDREFAIDQNNLILMKIFFDELKEKKELYLEECLLKNFDSIIVDEKRDKYNNDMFLFMKNKPIKHTNTLREIRNSSSLTKVFMPGSEWLYFKIYAEEIFVEKILKLLIKPIKELEEQKIIKNYHFIKYIDEGYHLRIRFQVYDTSNINLIINKIFKLLNPYQDTYISNIIIDSYNRELDRYGEDYMPISENIFSIDSSFVLNIINRELSKKWLYGLIGIDIYCDSLGLSLQEKMEFCKRHEIMFKNEFNATTETYKFINKKYSKHKEDVINLLSNYSELPFSPNLFKSQIEKELTKIKLDKTNKANILSSLIHMHIIRLVGPWNNRKIEFMLYSFCIKYYNYLKYTKQAIK